MRHTSANEGTKLAVAIAEIPFRDNRRTPLFGLANLTNTRQRTSTG